MSLIEIIKDTLSPTAPIEIGAQAPAPKISNHDGKIVDLAEIYPVGWVLIYFYPKSDSPICVQQACNLRDLYPKLHSEKGVWAYGVSTDMPAKLKEFRDKYKLPFKLLADPNKDLAKAFGVPVRLNFASRMAFLIKDGEVVWRNLDVDPKNFSEEVLAQLDN